MPLLSEANDVSEHVLMGVLFIIASVNGLRFILGTVLCSRFHLDHNLLMPIFSSETNGRIHHIMHT